MKFSNPLHQYLRRTTPKTAVIRKKAHAATLAAAALIVPSACGIYFRHAGLRENEPDWVWAASVVWIVHAAVALIALLFWLTEKPRPAIYLPVDDPDDDSGQAGEKSRQ
ncbi:MAG: hypothetical protein V4773_12725 [Verrucomicrobiota bacterium]